MIRIKTEITLASGIDLSAVARHVAGAGAGMAQAYPEFELWETTRACGGARYDIRDAYGRKKRAVQAIGAGGNRIPVPSIVQVGYYDRARKRPYIIGVAGSAGWGKPAAPLLGVWPCPEGAPWLSYGAASPQPLLALGGSAILSEALERYQFGSGTFDYASQKTLTDPTGLVRYTVGKEDFLAVCWGRYLVASERRGKMGLRVRNLTTASWADTIFSSRQIARLPGPVFGFHPSRREGQLFHCQHPADPSKAFLFAVHPGSATKISGDPGPTGNSFSVLAHGQATEHVFEFTANAVLDRPDPGPDPETGKVWAPVERSGSVAVAAMCLLECYWTSWLKADEDDPVEADYSDSSRAKIHLYKVHPDTFELTSFTKELREVLVAALPTLSEILACGIIAPYQLSVYDSEADTESALTAGYQLQLASTRWPFHPDRNSFQLQLGVKIKQSGIHTPRALSAEIRLEDGTIALLGNPRAPEQTIEEPYSGFLTDEQTRLEGLVTPYIEGSYGYSFFAASTGQLIYFQSFVTDACEPLEGYGDTENYPDQAQFFWRYQLAIANASEQFWAGLATARMALTAAAPVAGEIVQFPLPTQIGFDANLYFDPSRLPVIEHAGRNFGQTPAGVVAGGKTFTCEARPQRVATALTFYTNDEEYAGERPSGVEESKAWPTYDDWDPDHQISDWFRYSPCWVAIPELPTKVHGTVPMQAEYGSLEIYFRSWLVITDGSTVTGFDISCRFQLSDTTPRFDSYSAAFNIFQWSVRGTVIFILRLWPSDWTGPDSTYSDLSEVLGKLEPHLEVRSVSSPTTVLARRRLRPSADTEGAWSPVHNYPPHMLTNENDAGRTWVHVWTEWSEPGEANPRHATARCVWTGSALSVSDQVTEAIAKPSGRPSLLESTVAVAADKRIYWIDDCNAIKATESP